MPPKKHRRGRSTEGALLPDEPKVDGEASSGTGAAIRSAAAAGIPNAARLVLYSGPSKYNLAKLYDEYSVVCLEGDAYSVSDGDEWYAIALELDGQVVPFLRSEHVTMRIFDERDPDDGATQLFCQTSTAPYKDGFHYFRAVTWRQVGEYRVTFRLTNSRRVGAMLAAEKARYEQQKDTQQREGKGRGAGAGVPASSSSSSSPPPSRPPPSWVQLSQQVVVTDQEYEAQLIKALAADVEAVLEKERQDADAAAGYPLAPLSRKERAWLESEGPRLIGRVDPSPGELASLASSMAAALRTPWPKDPSLLVPLFESEPAKKKRLALEKAHRDALRTARVTSMQRLIRVATDGEHAHPSASSAASSASSSGAAEPRGGGDVSARSVEPRLGAAAVLSSFLRGDRAAGWGAGTADPCGDLLPGGAGWSPVDTAQSSEPGGLVWDVWDALGHSAPGPAAAHAGAPCSGTAGAPSSASCAPTTSTGTSRRSRYFKRGELVGGPGWGVYAPTRLADPPHYMAALRKQREWVASAEAEDRAQLTRSGPGGAPSSSLCADSGASSSSRRGWRPALGRSDRIIGPSSLRVYRYDPIPAGVTLVAVNRRGVGHALRRAWGDIAGGAVGGAHVAAWAHLRRVVRARSSSSTACGPVVSGKAVEVSSGDTAEQPSITKRGVKRGRQQVQAEVDVDTSAGAAEEARTAPLASSESGPPLGDEEDEERQGQGGRVVVASNRGTARGRRKLRATVPSSAEDGFPSLAPTVHLVVDPRRLSDLRAALGFGGQPPPDAAHSGAPSATECLQPSYPLRPAESLQLLLSCLGEQEANASAASRKKRRGSAASDHAPPLGPSSASTLPFSAGGPSDSSARPSASSSSFGLYSAVGTHLRLTLDPEEYVHFSRLMQAVPLPQLMPPGYVPGSYGKAAKEGVLLADLAGKNAGATSRPGKPVGQTASKMKD